MRITHSRIALGAALLVVTAIVGSCATLARAPSEVAGPRPFTFPGDWSKVPAKTITLFYPAQASWGFLMSPQHPGSEPLRTGMVTCSTCHEGQQAELGAKLVKHQKLEPDPIPGKRPTLDLSVRAAFDDRHVYFRFEWESTQPGVTHTLWRYDGKKWVRWGGPKPDVSKKGVTPSYEDRLAVLIGEPNTIPAYDGAKVTFSQAGCFITCHNSMRAMPKEPSRQALDAHPYWGKAGKKRDDIRKYLLITRTTQDEAGAWDKMKTPQELEALRKAGKFLDLWQWRAARSNPLGLAGDDYVLDYRWFDKGKNTFTSPGEPKWMYDRSKTGFSAIPEADLPKMLEKFPLITGKNAVPLDPAVPFKEGDILPHPVLQEPTESIADVLAHGVWKDKKWTVELRRKLDTGQPDDKLLVPGKVYDIGFSVFEDRVSNRRHLVTLPPVTLGLGVEADIKAVKLP
jgi:hypothetical protein